MLIRGHSSHNREHLRAKKLQISVIIDTNHFKSDVLIGITFCHFAQPAADIAMNHTFRLVWNRQLNMLVEVAECVRSQGKSAGGESSVAGGEGGITRPAQRLCAALRPVATVLAFLGLSVTSTAFKLECLSITNKLNPFALCRKLLIDASRTAYAQLQLCRAVA